MGGCKDTRKERTNHLIGAQPGEKAAVFGLKSGHFRRQFRRSSYSSFEVKIYMITGENKYLVE